MFSDGELDKCHIGAVALIGLCDKVKLFVKEGARRNRQLAVTMRTISPLLFLFVSLVTATYAAGSSNEGCEGKICGDDGSGGSCGSCAGHQVCTLFGAACSGPSDEGLYRVGVDYHSTTDDFSNSAFLTRYDEPGVRDLVIEQLQGMADGGATVISTRVWLVEEAGTSGQGGYRSSIGSAIHFRPKPENLNPVPLQWRKQAELDTTRLPAVPVIACEKEHFEGGIV